jgi:hypothetical protein
LHATAATWTGWRFADGSDLVVGIVAVAIRRGGRHVEELSTESKLVGTMSVGEQPVVANAMEAVREDVEQESANELADFERHRLALALLAVILPAESNFAVGE